MVGVMRFFQATSVNAVPKSSHRQLKRGGGAGGRSGADVFSMFMWFRRVFDNRPRAAAV